MTQTFAMCSFFQPGLIDDGKQHKTKEIVLPLYWEDLQTANINIHQPHLYSPQLTSSHHHIITLI